MPATPSGKVLVTGANGFIGIWVVTRLLERGYSVRGTVRTAPRAEQLKEQFQSYGERFECVVIDDITKPGVFDTSLNGIDAVAHIASPVIMTSTEPDDIIIPAVKGTTNILQSVLTHGTSVKRVVLTSSVGAIFTIREDPPVFSEKDWNDAAVAQVEANSKEGGYIYMASKVLAERAAWDVYEKNKGTVGWDLVVLVPPIVIGPVLHAVSNPQDLGFSPGEMYQFLCVRPEDRPPITPFDMGWIDVRDYADANIVALTKPEAGGERFVTSAGPGTWKDFGAAVRKVTKDLSVLDEPGGCPETVLNFKFDTTKADTILGVKYHAMWESMRDILADFKSRGWWEGVIADP
ncbi:D-lactaldehyde dehydrogenase [Amylocystis lapponica]|nr:D-lactaldehyde dehydrogenase [Amylocystis lapponica]